MLTRSIRRSDMRYNMGGGLVEYQSRDFLNGNPGAIKNIHEVVLKTIACGYGETWRRYPPPVVMGTPAAPPTAARSGRRLKLRR